MSLSPGHLKARLTALEQYPTDVVALRALGLGLDDIRRILFTEFF